MSAALARAMLSTISVLAVVSTDDVGRLVVDAPMPFELVTVPNCEPGAFRFAICNKLIAPSEVAFCASVKSNDPPSPCPASPRYIFCVHVPAVPVFLQVVRTSSRPFAPSVFAGTAIVASAVSLVSPVWDTAAPDCARLRTVAESAMRDVPLATVVRHVQHRRR